MAIVADKGNSEWKSEDDVTTRLTYSCLTERVCCSKHKGEQAYILLTPIGGYGAGAVANAVEQSGLKLLHMIQMPDYIFEEKKDEPI